VIGIIGILTADSNVSTRVGTRIYPIERAQQDALPAVTVDVDSVDPSDTKDGVSELDQSYITVTSFAQTYDAARLLSEDVRTALDRVSGTYNTEVIQKIQFLDQFTDKEENADKIIYWVEQKYKVRVKR